jgi:threonine synthase
MDTTLRCRCGSAPADPLLPFVCVERGGDDAEHILVRRLAAPRPLPKSPIAGNPFLRYRDRLHSHSRALAAGWDDARYAALVVGLDQAIARVDGEGFRVTPTGPQPALAAACGHQGELWVKDETGNVSGSHKARHLMGVALHLEVAGIPRDTPLAIASCGNAALAAAVVARAAQRPLQVFIPPDANPAVVARLQALGARLAVCQRRPGVPGDPCYHGFVDAVAAGALPFTCQGPDNGLTIEGGMGIGWELVEQLREQPLDRLFVQVGGAALASAVADGLFEAVQADELSRLPRLHLVQTASCWPLARAYRSITERIALELTLPPDAAARAETIAEAFDGEAVQGSLAWARDHRSRLMQPWESAPHSIAHGILDDETYDWYAACVGMLRSGGWPLVADEATLERANALARAHTEIPVDPTGSAGLAGLLALAGHMDGERVGVLFTGVERA